MRVFTTRQPIVARSVSLLWFKAIVVGTRYPNLPLFARRAVIAHEAAHLAGHHTEWRLLALLTLCPPLIRRVCHWQEYRADARAAATGHLHGMLHVLQSDRPESLTHPKNIDRRKKLMHTPHHV